jgi:lipopolysaccharide export system protein LptA
MARWQRHARLGLGVFAVAFAVVLWLVMGERQAPASAPAIERLDPKAVSEIRGGDVLQHKGAKRDIRVEFGSQISYDDGRNKFTTFKAFIDDRGGRSFTVSGNEAWVGKELSSYDVKGNVVLETSDGLKATTPEATFTEAEGILKGVGPVQFQKGRVTGSGVGFTYDRSLDRMWLLDKAVIQVAPTAEGGGMHVTSGAAGYSRAERYMRFERGMRMDRQGQLIEAEHSTVFLQRNRDEPENVELRGNSKITGVVGPGAATATGSLQAMQAQDINLHYAPDGRTLDRSLLMGQAQIQLARADNSPGQQLQAAESIDASLAPDGALTRLVARNHVRVLLPATAETGARLITAPVLDAHGEAGRGLTNMTFDNDAEYREEPLKGDIGRTARARTLKAAMASNDAIEAAEFLDGFRFEEGKLVATSSDAVYNVAKGTLALRRAAGTSLPHVADERVTIDAETVDVTLSPRKMNAAGKVSARFSAGRREGERGTTLLTDKEPILVTAEKFAFDEQSGTGSYTGKAVLWQQDSGTSIRAESIELNEKVGTLTAVGNVISNLPIAGRTDAGAKAMSVARAGEFQFDDSKRRAVFAKQAQLDGVQGNLHAKQIDLFLAPRDNTLERLEAQDGVKVILDKREATGQRLVYHPTDERYELTGAPVRLVQQCEESSGRTLTFYKASDKIQVDGNEEIRVQTKGGKCPEPPD